MRMHSIGACAMDLTDVSDLDLKQLHLHFRKGEFTPFHC